MLSEQELLEMERPVSARHAPMRRCDRAAQFAPFAALSGFGEAVQEAGRVELPTPAETGNHLTPYLYGTDKE